MKWMIPEKALFRPDEVADYTSISLRQVQREMGRGEFGPIWGKGRLRRITYTGLVEFLEKHMDVEGVVG